MTDSPTLRLAQSLALLGSSSLTGYITSFSTATVPALAIAAQTSPLQVAKQWHALYKIGASTAPPLAFATAIATGYLASCSYVSGAGVFDQSAKFYLYAAATVLAPSIAPWTLTAMVPTNNALTALGKASEAEVEKRKGDLLQLLRRWRGLNLVRAALVGLGAVSTIAAVVWC